MITPLPFAKEDKPDTLPSATWAVQLNQDNTQWFEVYEQKGETHFRKMKWENNKLTQESVETPRGFPFWMNGNKPYVAYLDIGKSLRFLPDEATNCPRQTQSLLPRWVAPVADNRLCVIFRSPNVMDEHVKAGLFKQQGNIFQETQSYDKLCHIHCVCSAGRHLAVGCGALDHGTLHLFTFPVLPPFHLAPWTREFNAPVVAVAMATEGNTLHVALRNGELHTLSMKTANLPVQGSHRLDSPLATLAMGPGGLMVGMAKNGRCWLWRNPDLNLEPTFSLPPFATATPIRQAHAFFLPSITVEGALHHRVMMLESSDSVSHRRVIHFPDYSAHQNDRPPMGVPEEQYDHLLAKIVHLTGGLDTPPFISEVETPVILAENIRLHLRVVVLNENICEPGKLIQALAGASRVLVYGHPSQTLMNTLEALKISPLPEMYQPRQWYFATGANHLQRIETEELATPIGQLDPLFNNTTLPLSQQPPWSESDLLFNTPVPGRFWTILQSHKHSVGAPLPLLLTAQEMTTRWNELLSNELPQAWSSQTDGTKQNAILQTMLCMVVGQNQWLPLVKNNNDQWMLNASFCLELLLKLVQEAQNNRNRLDETESRGVIDSFASEKKNYQDTKKLATMIAGLRWLLESENRLAVLGRTWLFPSPSPDESKLPELDTIDLQTTFEFKGNPEHLFILLGIRPPPPWQTTLLVHDGLQMTNESQLWTLQIRLYGSSFTNVHRGVIHCNSIPPEAWSAFRLFFIERFKELPRHRLIGLQTEDHHGLVPGEHKGFLVLSDLAGFTVYNKAHGNAIARNLLGFHAMQRSRLVKKYAGHALKSTGDGHFFSFADGVQAIQFAMELFHHPESDPLPIRFGIHYGEFFVTERGDDIGGDDINMTSRVCEAIKEPNGISVSRAAFLELQNRHPNHPDLNLAQWVSKQLKETEMKGVLDEEERILYRIL